MHTAVHVFKTCDNNGGRTTMKEQKGELSVGGGGGGRNGK